MPDAVYDRIGRTYSSTRRPDPRIAAAIVRALGDAEVVVNVGAGTGAYEPDDRAVVAVEPSWRMIQQRHARASSVVQASAESLPFPDQTFDAVEIRDSCHRDLVRHQTDDAVAAKRRHDRIEILGYEDA